MVKFSEVFRCSGVDDNPQIPGRSRADPGMIILAKGWNLVALENGSRLRVHCDNQNIRIEELEETREEIARSLGLIAKEGSFPENVDAKGFGRSLTGAGTPRLT
jgi:hypothetical protein